MRCNEFKDLIFEAVLAGETPAGTAREHMTACAACQKEYDGMRATMNVLDTWTAPEPSPYFDVRLRARLREVKEEQPQRGFAAWMNKIAGMEHAWRPAAAGALAIALAVGGGLYSMGGRSARNNGNQVVAACPVVDLQALDQNQQVLNELQDLDDGGNNTSNSGSQVNE